MNNDRRGNPSGLERLCYWASLGYGQAVSRRAALYRRASLQARHLPCSVISIGNLTVGGTGKTPLVVYAARRLRQWGYRVAVVSRGYGGRLEKKGGLVSNGADLLCSPRDAGDEPAMMAQHLQGVPIAVGRDRVLAARGVIEAFDTQVILLDDGFQHLKLARDLDILLLDARRPFGNRHLLPRGVLREPVSALKRAQVVVLTRAEGDMSGPIEMVKTVAGRRPVFTARHRPAILKPPRGAHGDVTAAGTPLSGDQLETLAGKRVFAFSGIARNDDFQHTLRRFPWDLVGAADFSDHHWYSAADIARLEADAGACGADVICTTEKDRVRLDPSTPFTRELYTVGISMAFEDRAFDTFLAARVATLRGKDCG